MKLRIKLSNSKKFIITLKENNCTLIELKNCIYSYIKDNYGEERSNIFVSFNGKDAIRGEESTELSELGIVNCDLLTIISSNEIPVAVQQNIEANSSISKPNLIMESSSSSSESPQLVKSVGAGNYNEIQFLLEAVDGSPPKSVIDAFNRYDPSTSSQAMNILIHLAVIERGFLIDDSSSGTTTLPSSWRDAIVTLKYHHPGLNDFNCSIVIVTMGAIKQVLASFDGQENEISVKLDTKVFVPSNQILPHRLSKLGQLAKTIRNQLLFPLQVAAHLILGLPAPWHVIGLPQEILVKIGSMLPLKDLIALSSTCKSLNDSSADNKLWFLFFKRDFKEEAHPSDTISGSNWKAKYKDTFVKKKKTKTYQTPLEMPHYIPPTHPLPQFPMPDPMNLYLPQPRAPNPYPIQPDYPNPNPFYDPDSPYFGGEIPPMAGPFPNPFGGRPPRNPFGPQMPRNPRGPGAPRFDYF